uniref:GmrSD restriction endonucleases N-terminal domain-containing protein n=1 Tax=Candidatus Kentrum sp. MB TaxID=2138164 RepID=A0A450XPI9_9GAMM|nr:MAG: Protein of unknown function DUF262 [Candidatus Kentron sp. MB]VFK31177.1 MAG: Protein of unknown function DUF262 [Candidatus Kentron sp. MB]VFK75379.1 MAG: Protein of unknown function DUF262 [Candidatus Kentron sp. MB]
MATTEELIVSIESNSERARTKSLDLSFNELLDMYLNGELNIAPGYQRLFRWTRGTQSRFIESLLLEMPIPPIYVVEDEHNSYELIDGLQRFSSYLHLRGELDAVHLDVKKGNFLELQDCDIVEDLNGLTFKRLPVSLQIRLKRSFIRVEVVKKGSDRKFRYHMFKKLNIGGEPVTSQEIRNCTIRMLNQDFIEFINKMSNKEDYEKCIGKMSGKQSVSGFDQELVLRFFAIKNFRENFKHDVADFLTEYMEKVSDPDEENVLFDYGEEERTFDKTFLILRKSLGNKSFGRVGKSGIGSNFSVYHFEAICAGLQAIMDCINPENIKHVEKVRKRLEEIKKDPDFISATTGGGKNSPGQLDNRIRIVTDKLSGLLL